MTVGFFPKITLPTRFTKQSPTLIDNGNKLNCFISARGMLAIVWHCVLLFCFVCVFVDF